MNNKKKKFKSNTTYPKQKWVKDPVDPELEFNEAIAYKIKKSGNPPEHLDTDRIFVCTHCNESREFFIERKNHHKFRCVKCGSIIETGGS